MNGRKSGVSIKRWNLDDLEHFSILAFIIRVSLSKAEQFRLTRFQDKSSKDVFLNKFYWTQERFQAIKIISVCFMLHLKKYRLGSDAGIQK